MERLFTPTLFIAALAMLLAFTLAGCQPDEAIAAAFPTAWKLLAGGVALLFGRLWVKDSWLRGLVYRAGVAGEQVVLEVEQTHVDHVKAGKLASSPGGATLTPEEARGARKAALDKLLEILGGRGLVLLGWILGVGKGTIDTVLGTAVEAGVKKMSIAQAAVKNGVAAAGPPQSPTLSVRA